MAPRDERLAVGTEDDGATFPASHVLTGRGFVTGKSGSGKSNTASVVAEELLERGHAIMVVDTDAEYYGLAERYEVLTVGLGPAVDLDVRELDPHALADLALGDNVPVLFDVSDLDSGEETTGRMRAVLDALFEAQKAHRQPFLVLVEEIHEFLPERGGSDELAETLVRIAKRGRKRGLGICGLSQRPAAVSKDFITQCDWLVWHRLTWENDTKVVDRVAGSEAAETVQTLDDGEALVMADWEETLRRVQFRRKHTTDAGATPDLDDADSTIPTIGDDLVARARSTGAADRAVEADDEDDRDADNLPATRDEDSAGPPAGTGPARGDGTGRAARASGDSGFEQSSSSRALAELGDLVVHFVDFLLASVGWTVDTAERALAARLAVESKRLLRLLAMVAVGTAFVAVFLLALALFSLV